MRIPLLLMVLMPMVLIAAASAKDPVCSDFHEDTTATPSILFDSAVACMTDGDIERGSRLMILGQMRALVDLSLFSPKNDEAKSIAADLYGRLYYQLGGSGPEDIITNADRFIALVDFISAWEPEDLLDYEPEWEYESPPSHERYLLEVERTKIFRIKQLMSYRRHLLEGKDDDS